MGIREIMVASMMGSAFLAFLALVASSFRTRVSLQAEILALRHQLAVLQRNAPRRLRLKRSDRLLWILLSRCWSGWRRCVRIVQPDTVVRWQRRAFAVYWTWKSRPRPGRPRAAAEIRDLIRRMSQANRLWGAPRIHGGCGSFAFEARAPCVNRIAGVRSVHAARMRGDIDTPMGYLGGVRRY